MPATSSKQQKFMAMCAFDRKRAKGSCPPMEVAKEFAKKEVPEKRKRGRPRKK